jgi:DNA-binding CsgD family transcriptional regulator
MYSGKLTPSNFNQYAFSQANYAICNHFTAKKKDSFVDSMDEKEIDIIDKRIDNDVIEYYDMISTLEPRLRECVNLFVMGYTRHEIADNLHIGIQTVYNYLNQSRDLLQKLNKIGKK